MRTWLCALFGVTHEARVTDSLTIRKTNRGSDTDRPNNPPNDSCHPTTVASKFENMRSFYIASLVATQVLVAIDNADAFSSQSIAGSTRCKSIAGSAGSTGTTLFGGSKGIDVSDLGLTMEDLDAPLPDEMFSVTSSGTETTSRVPGVQDDGCVWEEGPDSMDVTLSIPGLRGQPPAALSLDITKNTATITAFGMACWSCILRGNCDPESVSFSATDGNDMIPLITISVKKVDSSERWGGFIAQVGEDSIL